MNGFTTACTKSTSPAPTSLSQNLGPTKGHVYHIQYAKFSPPDLLNRIQLRSDHSETYFVHVFGQEGPSNMTLI